MRQNLVTSILALVLFTTPSLGWADEGATPPSIGVAPALVLSPVSTEAQTVAPHLRLLLEQRNADHLIPTRIRNPRMKTAGIIITSIGLAASAANISLGVAGLVLVGYVDSNAALRTIVPFIGTGGLLALTLPVGIPLWGVGGQRIPAVPKSAWARPELMLSPRSMGLCWKF